MTPSAQIAERHHPFEATKHQSTPLFRNFDHRCLKDYSQYAIINHKNELKLDFDANVETAIFRHLPTNLSSFKNTLTIPAALVYGTQSDLYPHYFFKRFARQNKNIALYTTAGGHMFPLEHPEKVAHLIKGIIKAW